MKTFLKILLFVAIGLVILKIFPLLLIPAVVSVIALLAIGAVLMSGLAAMLGTALSVVVALLVVALILLVALSPVWLPVLAIIGIVSLFRRRSKTSATTV